MRGQGTLDLGDVESPADRDALVAGIQATLEALAESQVLTARHRGLIELLRAEARDYVTAHGIARTNYARLIGEHLTMLLDLEGPAEQDGADDAGSRITQLSEFLRERRTGATDVRDAAQA